MECTRGARCRKIKVGKQHYSVTCLSDSHGQQSSRTRAQHSPFSGSGSFTQEFEQSIKAVGFDMVLEQENLHGRGMEVLKVVREQVNHSQCPIAGNSVELDEL